MMPERKQEISQAYPTSPMVTECLWEIDHLEKLTESLQAIIDGGVEVTIELTEAGNTGKWLMGSLQKFLLGNPFNLKPVETRRAKIILLEGGSDA